MLHLISLTLVLIVLWLLLSGIYIPLLLTLGVVCSVFVVVIAARMDVVDHEGHPIHLHYGHYVVYMSWLVWQIVKANVDVTWRVLHPRLPISPTMRRFKTNQHTDLGQAIFANSITLTPGTITIDVSKDEIEVHALTQQAMQELLSGEMDHRVSKLEKSD